MKNNEIKVIRIDNRLIHTQVILTWIKHLNINSIIIVDDEIADNEFLKEIYRLTIPPHIFLRIFRKEDIIGYYNNQDYFVNTKRRTMIIMKELSTAEFLYERGCSFECLQLGWKPQKGKNDDASIDKFNQELQYFKDKKIPVFYQGIPLDPKIYLSGSKKSKRAV